MPPHPDEPLRPHTVTIHNLTSGATKQYKVVGTTHSYSTGWRYELSPIPSDRRNLISRVCHAPIHPVAWAITNGERIEYHWSPPPTQAAEPNQ